MYISTSLKKIKFCNKQHTLLSYRKTGSGRYNQNHNMSDYFVMEIYENKAVTMSKLDDILHNTSPK